MSARVNVRQTVHLRPDQVAALRALSAATRRPMADFLRQAVDRVLAKHETIPAKDETTRSPTDSGETA